MWLSLMESNPSLAIFIMFVAFGLLFSIMAAIADR
jgi:hypothetical protein